MGDGDTSCAVGKMEIKQGHLDTGVAQGGQEVVFWKDTNGYLAESVLDGAGWHGPFEGRNFGQLGSDPAVAVYAIGQQDFRNYRIRSLLYAGKPNWDLLATIRPH